MINSKAINRPIVFLGVLGLLLIICQIRLTIPAFDDAYMLRWFRESTLSTGFFGGLWRCLTNNDLPTEYRTYGFARALHYILWFIGDDRGVVNAIFISVFQLTSAFLIRALIKRAGYSEVWALSAASMWVASVFSANWSFHHYSYTLLPWNLAILAAYCLVTGLGKWPLFMILGGMCALSGELHILAVPFFMIVCYLVTDRSKHNKKCLFSFLATTFVALMVHYLHWRIFVSQAGPHRYEVQSARSISDFLTVFYISFKSIFAVGLDEIVTSFRSGYKYAIPLWLLFAAAFFWATAKLSDTAINALKKRKLIIFLVCLFALQSAIYLALASATGQVSDLMPRRYGFVSLTIFAAALALCGAELIGRDKFKSRVFLSFVVGGFVAMTGQFYVGSVLPSRISDRLLIEKIRTAGAGLDRGVLMFVSSDLGYWDGVFDAVRPGPKMDDSGGIWMIESPFAQYWTAQHYLANVSGFAFVGMPGWQADGPNIIGAPYGVKNATAASSVIVANLGLDMLDPKGNDVQIFRSFADFSPHFFSKYIEKNPFEVAAGSAMQVIDLGGAGGAGVWPDKKFGVNPPRASGLIEDYGLLEGVDSVYSNPAIGAHYSYFGSNRNSNFTYRINLKKSSDAQISLDFWEQWGRRPGERVFTLDVSWDGKNWSNVGALDPSKINGEKPFSVVIRRHAVKDVWFRLSASNGAIDVPMIQGIRIKSN